MVPGWTLPGVMTTGAAQTLWRSYRTLPGARVARRGVRAAQPAGSAGAGAGRRRASRPSPRRRPPPSAAPSPGSRWPLAGPRLAATGLALRAGLRRRGIPVLHGAALESVEAVPGGLRAVLGTGSGAASHAVDAVLMNEGFEPQAEILRLLGARDALRRGLRAPALRARRADGDQRAGPVRGGRLRGPRGRHGGRGRGAPRRARGGGPRRARRRGRRLGRRPALLGRHWRFQRRLWTLHDPAPAPSPARAMRPSSAAARRSRSGQVRAGLDEGPTHAGTLKRVTRLGRGAARDATAARSPRGSWPRPPGAPWRT